MNETETEEKPRFGVHIKASTTLGELAMLKGQYGITRIVLQTDYRLLLPYVAVATFERTTAIGTGMDEIEALNDMFARVIHRTGALFMPAGGWPTS